MHILRSNVGTLHMDDVKLDLNFNHCTVLMYYADGSIKDTASLGTHCDCTYCPKTKLYEKTKNSQVYNIPVVIYSIGDKRKLIWSRRKAMVKQGEIYI